MCVLPQKGNSIEAPPEQDLSRFWPENLSTWKKQNKTYSIF